MTASTASLRSAPLFLFAPGAGAGSSSGWMRAWAERLALFGRVAPFDYRYRLEGRRTPDRLPALIAAHREALRQARADHDGPVVLAGKSMGGRIGCHVALEEPVDGVICFGYPLKGTTGAVRDEVLLALRVPILFIQGTRDPLCPLDMLDAVRGRMATPTSLHVVNGGDHSLLVRKGDLKIAGGTQADVDGEIVEAIRTFLVSAPR